MHNRRDFCLSLSALAALAQFAETTAAAEPTAANAAQTAAQVSPDALAAGTAIFKDNHIFDAATLPIKQSAVGSSQQVTHGVLPTGEGIEMHNSVLAPGQQPHPPHQHPHAEFLFLTQGDVDWLIDGKRQPAKGGDVLYAAPGVLHGMRNVGSTPAKYFVLAIGPNLAHPAA